MGHRVVCAEFMHETNTFSVLATDEAAFRGSSYHEGPEVAAAFAGTRSAMGAAFEAASELDWDLVHPVVAHANPSGRVTDAFFLKVASILEEACRGADGVLLHLHGSMSTASNDDGEGVLLERLRAVVGRQVPIVIVLDLHATVTERMGRHADAIIAYRTYPHIDQYESFWKGARLLNRAMKNEIRPNVALARRPILYALDGGRTNSAPMRELLRRGDALEAEGKALVVSIHAGFSSADVLEGGPSVAVTTDGDPVSGQALAEELMDYAWEQRHHSTITFTPIAEAIAEAKNGAGAGRPLVISDYSDNPGAGAYGDATTFLKAMIEADLKNAAFYAICDPQAVLEAQRAGVGSKVTISLGGKVDPSVGGGPLKVTGEVAAITEGSFIAYGPMGGGTRRRYGLSLRLRVGGIDVIVISRNGQATDLAQLTSLGIEPTRLDTIAVKSMQHFRAAFEPIARKVLEIDSGALCTKNFKARPYRKIRRPVFALDDI